MRKNIDLSDESVAEMKREQALIQLAVRDE